MLPCRLPYPPPSALSSRAEIIAVGARVPYTNRPAKSVTAATATPV